MDIQEYVLKAKEIGKREFMSRLDLASEMKIAYSTLVRLELKPELCSIKTMKKLKMFVEDWESK